MNTTQYTTTHMRARLAATDKHTSTHTHTHTHTHVRANTSAHGHTQTETCARAHTHTHTHTQRGKEKIGYSVAGEGVTKRAASGPFGTFCHHVVTKRKHAAVTKRAGSASDLIHKTCRSNKTCHNGVRGLRV